MKKALLISCFLFVTSVITKAQGFLPVGNGLPGGYVSAFDTLNGNLYVGGSFDTNWGAPSNYLAVWNGSLWSPVEKGTNGSVNSIIDYNGSLYIGGAFTEAFTTSDDSWVYYLAYLNGGVWNFGDVNDLNSYVSAMANYNGNLYVGGNFTGTIGNSSSPSHIGMVDGTIVDTLGAGMNNDVYSLTAYNGNLYVGGSFTQTDRKAISGIAQWNGTVWSAVGNSIKGTVYTSIVYHNKLYVAGEFTYAAGNPGNNIASWNDTAWAYDSIEQIVRALAVYDDTLYAAGDYTNNYGGHGNNILRLKNNKWVPIMPGVNGDIYGMGTYKNDLYIGGNFDTAGGRPMTGIAKYNDTAIGVGINELSSSNAFSVYPNPSTGIFTIKSSVASSKSSVVEVYNMLGEKVASTALSTLNSTFSIDLSSQPSGIYLYRIINNNGTCNVTGKLIKQ